MRLRWLVLSLLASLLVVAPASAQFGPIGPGGVIQSTTAAVSASTQVGTAQTFYTFTVGTATVLTQPIKLKSIGYLSSMESSPGTFTITVSFGGVSVTPVSAVTLATGVETVPYWLDCNVETTNSTGLAKELVCEFSYETAGGLGAASTITRYARRTTGTLSATTQQAITATVTFSNTSNGTGLVAQSNKLLMGN